MPPSARRSRWEPRERRTLQVEEEAGEEEAAEEVVEEEVEEVEEEEEEEVEDVKDQPLERT
jgi:hypothetical protein